MKSEARSHIKREKEGGGGEREEGEEKEPDP